MPIFNTVHFLVSCLTTEAVSLLLQHEESGRTLGVLMFGRKDGLVRQHKRVTFLL